jgi:type IV pilus assembly protein PilV
MKSANTVQLKKRRSAAASQGGIGLIEVLIAVLILAIGLLGLASMQTNGIRMTNGSMSRTQAVFLANDIVERARANRTNRANYILAVDAAGNVAPCDVTVAYDPLLTVAQNDMAEWLNSLACLLPEADANIALDVPTNRMAVTIQWNDRNDDADDGTLLVRTQL